jgi:formate-dependent phosphoribosylglycinamide formyltransferase (GAR transformylase)
MSTLNGRGVLGVEAHTADDTLTVAENGTCHTNTGASGTVVLTLPAATVGLRFVFGVGAAQALRIDPAGSETISLPSSGVPGAAGKYLEADAVGETVDLACLVAGNWSVLGFTGTWTAQG